VQRWVCSDSRNSDVKDDKIERISKSSSKGEKGFFRLSSCSRRKEYVGGVRRWSPDEREWGHVDWLTHAHRLKQGIMRGKSDPLTNDLLVISPGRNSTGPVGPSPADDNTRCTRLFYLLSFESTCFYALVVTTVEPRSSAFTCKCFETGARGMPHQPQLGLGATIPH
jgi:hypothetical protein